MIQIATTAGLKLEVRDGLLANPADPRPQSAFDSAIRGKTDQFVLRLKKPK